MTQQTGRVRARVGDVHHVTRSKDDGSMLGDRTGRGDKDSGLANWNPDLLFTPCSHIHPPKEDEAVAEAGTIFISETASSPAPSAPQIPS